MASAKMNQTDSLPPDFFCPNPHLDCPGKGADLVEIREPVRDDRGVEIGSIIFMACTRCGYRWDRDSSPSA